jgi:hypothetical protein
MIARTRISITSVVAMSLMAVTLLLAPASQAAGLVNCVDQGTEKLVSCWELVWVDGTAYRMTFPQAGVPRSQPAGATVQDFYVTAPQTDVAQGALPFPHDHVIAVMPGQSGYSRWMHGYFVLCSADGISTGGCVPEIMTVPGLGTVPVADSINGESLTSVDPIVDPANADLFTLIDTGAVFVGIINPNGRI